MFLSLILSTIAMSFCQGAQPITIKAERSNGDWVIPIEIDGIKTSVKLDGAHGPSYFGKHFAERNHLNLKAEHVFSANRTVICRSTVSDQTVVDSPNVAGDLGLDVLKNCAIGFDLHSSEVTIWPSDDLDPEVAKTWVVGGEPRPGETGAAKPWETEILQDDLNFLVVNIDCAGNRVPFRLLTSSSNPYIPSKALKRLPSVSLNSHPVGSSAFIITGCHFGALGPWDVFLSGASAPDGGPVGDGYIGVNYLNSRRVIIDYPNLKLYEQISDTMTRSLMALESSSGVPFYLDGHKLRVGTNVSPRLNALSGTLARPGDEVISYRGVAAKELISVLNPGDNPAIKNLLALQTLFEKQPKTLILKRGDKTFEIVLGSQPST